MLVVGTWQPSDAFVLPSWTASVELLSLQTSSISIFLPPMLITFFPLHGEPVRTCTDSHCHIGPLSGVNPNWYSGTGSISSFSCLLLVHFPPVVHTFYNCINKQTKQDTSSYTLLILTLFF